MEQQRKLAENRFIIADMHLGEGLYRDGVLNNIEYFDADQEFYDFIQLVIKERDNSRTNTELIFLGDTFDFLTTEFTWEEKDRKGIPIKKGRLLAEPYEDASIQKIEKILDAHPLVIDAMKKFLRYGTIKFFVGNHDLELVWANVQSAIRRVLTEGMDNKEKINTWKRIKFIDHNYDFKEIKNGVLFEHGNNSEPTCAMPKKVFLNSRLGQPVIPSLLNHPYGNHLVDLANKLTTDSFGCKGNYWIGRLEPHWYVYSESLRKNWRFVFYATIMWIITPFRHRFSRRWWVRKNASFWKLFRHNFDAMAVTIWNKVRGRDFSYYAKQTLKDDRNIDTVVSAHHHEFRYEITEDGTYANPGPWCMVYKAELPEITLTWNRFRWLERKIKKLLAKRKMFHKKTYEKHKPKKQKVYSFLNCTFYDDGYKEVRLMRYNSDKKCIEALN